MAAALFSTGTNQAPAKTPYEDAVAILRTVIVRESADYVADVGKPNPDTHCVVAATDQTTFDRQRAYRAELKKRLTADSANEEFRRRYEYT